MAHANCHVCLYCEKLFSSEKHLTLHLKKVHEITCAPEFTIASGAQKPSVKGKIKTSKIPIHESNRRMKGVTIVKPIIYGNVAWHLGEKEADEDDKGHTHQWSVYLRSYENENISVYVNRVQFKLHESYKEPIRVVHKSPFTITETGWGEFEIAIKIYFQDSTERPVTIYHNLKLFDREQNGNVKMVLGSVESEQYDELVFINPTIMMHRLLTMPKRSTEIASHTKDYELKKAQDLKKILEAKQKVKEEIEHLKLKLALTKDNLQKMRKKVEQ